MIFRRFAGLFTLTFLMFIFCCVSHKIETQIGFFNLSGPPLTESTVLTQLGEGRMKAEQFNDKVLGKSHVFYAGDTGSWVELDFSHVLTENKERVLETILMTKERLCDEIYVPKKPFGQLATGKGLRLGDSLDRVLETYGKPTTSIEVGRDKVFSMLAERLNPKEGLILRYLPKDSKDNRFMEFHFIWEKLHSLLISVSE